MEQEKIPLTTRGASTLIAPKESNFKYDVSYIDKVIDGDSVVLTIDRGFREYKRIKVRLAGIDTPEMKGGTNESKYYARMAKQRVFDLLHSDELVECQTDTKSDSFGRVLAWIWVGGRNLNELLVRENLAVRYEGQSKAEVADDHARNFKILDKLHKNR